MSLHHAGWGSAFSHSLEEPATSLLTLGPRQIDDPLPPNHKTGREMSSCDYLLTLHVFPESSICVSEVPDFSLQYQEPGCLIAVQIHRHAPPTAEFSATCNARGLVYLRGCECFVYTTACRHTDLSCYVMLFGGIIGCQFASNSVLPPLITTRDMMEQDPNFPPPQGTPDGGEKGGKGSDVGRRLVMLDGRGEV